MNGGDATVGRSDRVTALFWARKLSIGFGLFCVATAPLLGCVANTPAPSTPQSSASRSGLPAVAPPSAAVPSTAPPSVEVPDTPAGRQLAWVLAAMNQGPSEADLPSHFTQEFLTSVPVAKLVALSKQITSQGPFVLEKVLPAKASAPDKLFAVMRSSQGPRLTVQLAVALDSGRIRMLLLKPQVDVKPARSWEEVEDAIRAVAPAANFLAAEIDGGKCIPVSSFEPQKPLALGSTFKLYILDALAAQIASGKHGWDDPLAIQDALKSLPSGAMRDESAGKTFSVRHYAEQMISVSDNTAADHLLALVGRSAVEDAVRASGHATPSLLQPFLSTREVFALKLLVSTDERTAYVAADTPHKRKLLDAYGRLDLGPAMAQAAFFTKPLMIDSIEWFASPEDLCKVTADLHARADVAATSPVGSILSKNPGIPDENKQYAYIGFKGGSEPGVLNLTWLLQRARDGKWLFLTVGFNDNGAALDPPKALAAAATAREFLGR